MVGPRQVTLQSHCPSVFALQICNPAPRRCKPAFSDPVSQPLVGLTDGVSSLDVRGQPKHPTKCICTFHVVINDRFLIPRNKIILTLYNLNYSIQYKILINVTHILAHPYTFKADAGQIEDIYETWNKSCSLKHHLWMY